MTQNIKVGDTVKAIHGYAEGTTFVVESIGQYPGQDPHAKGEGVEGGAFLRNLELVKPAVEFKVGDKVKVVSGAYKVGAEFVIERIRVNTNVDDYAIGREVPGGAYLRNLVLISAKPKVPEDPDTADIKALIRSIGADEEESAELVRRFNRWYTAELTEARAEARQEVLDAQEAATPDAEFLIFSGPYDLKPSYECAELALSTLAENGIYGSAVAVDRGTAVFTVRPPAIVLGQPVVVA